MPVLTSYLYDFSVLLWHNRPSPGGILLLSHFLSGVWMPQVAWCDKYWCREGNSLSTWSYKEWTGGNPATGGGGEFSRLLATPKEICLQNFALGTFSACWTTLVCFWVGACWKKCIERSTELLGSASSSCVRSPESAAELSELQELVGWSRGLRWSDMGLKT